MSNRGRFTRSDPIHKNIERKEKRYLLIGPLNRALGIRRCINRAIQLNEDSFTAFTTGTIGVKTIRGVEIQSNANVKVPDFLKKKKEEGEEGKKCGMKRNRPIGFAGREFFVSWIWFRSLMNFFFFLPFYESNVPILKRPRILSAHTYCSWIKWS